jgi:hypothetical protein
LYSPSVEILFFVLIFAQMAEIKPKTNQKEDVLPGKCEKIRIWINFKILSISGFCRENNDAIFEEIS